jgi:ABC-type dipeptide/oligopeptide/nickel transport system permease subunit
MINLTTIRTRIIPVCAAVVFLILSAINVQRIGASITSFAGSVMLMAIHAVNRAVLPNANLLEYWIAGIAWCAAAFFIARAIVSPVPDHFTAPVRAARAALFGFLFIACCAPILAPLPPLAQGRSLQHDRFLAPFTRGTVVESLTVLQPADADFIDRTVLIADNFLLHRTTSFSRTPETSEAIHTPDVPAGEKRSSILFVFGTDGVGRDILSRVVYGSRYSLGIGFVVVFISLAIGSAAGMLAGYAGGFIDGIIMRTVDVFLSIPSLFLALTLIAIIGQSLMAMIVVLAATGWMTTARVVRGDVLRLRRREFISASQLLGTSPAGILRLHIFPNVLPLIKNAGILQLGNIILAEASMSFLGLGIQQPEPSWGNMIAESMTSAGSTPYTAIVPGIALSILIISVHIVGEHSQ